MLCTTIVHKERSNFVAPMQRFVIHELTVSRQQLADAEAEFGEFRRMKPGSIEPFHRDLTIFQSFSQF
jgi:hypothetical protein